MTRHEFALPAKRELAIRAAHFCSRARLLHRARTERSDFQILLTRYALERLLYRLSVSPHRDRFILKGAMLFVTWVDDPFRPTRDLDLLGHGDNDAESIAETFRTICSQPVADDGVAFDVAALTAAPIREEVEYGGVRVQTTAMIAGARIPIQVDIGFGDAITREAVEIDYPVLVDAPAPRLRAYPVETVVAEKFEALVRSASRTVGSRISTTSGQSPGRSSFARSTSSRPSSVLSNDAEQRYQPMFRLA